MALIFVSHSSADRRDAEHVQARLRAAGYAALFVDFDPEQGIPAGHDWKRELYAQLRRADAVVFLASADSAASQWCAIEVGLAQSLGMPVFPLRLEPDVQMPLLDDVQWVDGADDEGMDRLLGGLRAAGLDPDESYSWDPRRSPYPGLAPFAVEDAAVFFGRERETDRLVELLQPTLQRGAGRFVGIVGPSGSGKSSLLRAGLLPRLARQPGRWVLVPPLLPGRQPTRDLAGCLARAFADEGEPRSTDDLAAELKEGPAGLRKVAEALAELAGNDTHRPNVLIVVDQAEELLTRTGPVEQQTFLDLLTGALTEDSPLWVVATVRSEFLSSAPDRAGLAEAIDDTLVIEPLSRARLAEVIAGPARRAGLEFAPGLVEQMVQDTVGGDALPLLAHTLHELAQRAGPDGAIGTADYDAVGGVVGALRNRADRVADELGRRGHGELVVPTLVRLATVTGQDEPTRRRVRRSTLTPDERVVMDAFVDARLLTSDHDPATATATATATDEAGGDTTVEVAHEALLRQWPPLREAIEADRNGLRLRSELERLAADWERADRDEAYLLRGARLAVFEEWAAAHPDELGPSEPSQASERSWDAGASQAEYVRRSRAGQRREVRRWRTVAAVLSVLALAAAALTFVAVRNSAQLATQLAAANAQVVARESSARLGRDPVLAAELALVAWRSAPDSPQARSALADAYVVLAGTDSVVHTQPDRDPVEVITVDGELLGVAAADGRFVVRSLTTGAEVRALPPDTTVSEDGRYSMTCLSHDSPDQVETSELIVHDVVSGVELRRIQLRRSCDSVRYTYNGRYAVENLRGSEQDSPADPARVIDLASGATYQFVAPTFESALRESQKALGISALPTPDGGLDVFVAVGPSVLRIPARREPLALDLDFITVNSTITPDGLFIRQVPTAAGAQQSRFTLNDTVTGAQVAERTVDTRGGWTVDDALWGVGSDDDIVWYLDRYALPDLTPTLRLPVPRLPDSDPLSIGAAIDDATANAAVHANNTLTAFDTRTGNQLGAPISVPAVHDRALLWTRADRPGEVIIAASYDLLEVWDIPTGTRLGSADLSVFDFHGAVTRGDTLVALTTDGEIEQRSLPGLERLDAPILAPDIGALIGFDAEGRLVAGTGNFGMDQVVFWDLERRAESGRMRPNGGTPRSVDGGLMTIDGDNRLLPLSLDVRASAWYEHLCRLLPPSLSITAANLLPAGADRSSPCV